MREKRTRAALDWTVVVVVACLGSLVSFSLVGYPRMGETRVGFSLVEWRIAQRIWPPYTYAITVDPTAQAKWERACEEALVEASKKDVLLIFGNVVEEGTNCKSLWYTYVYGCAVFGFLIGGLIGDRIFRLAWNRYSTAPAGGPPEARRRRLRFALICSFGVLLALMGALEGFFAVELKRTGGSWASLFLRGERIEVDGKYLFTDFPVRADGVSWWCSYATKSAAEGFVGGVVVGMLLGYVVYLAVYGYGSLYVARLRKTAFVRDPEAVP
jgi:hypothetical protein